MHSTDSTTHWIPPFTLDGPQGTQLAYCGAWVTRSAPEPTCPDCQRLMQAGDPPEPATHAWDESDRALGLEE